MPSWPGAFICSFPGVSLSHISDAYRQYGGCLLCLCSFREPVVLLPVFLKFCDQFLICTLPLLHFNWLLCFYKIPSFPRIDFLDASSSSSFHCCPKCNGRTLSLSVLHLHISHTPLCTCNSTGQNLFPYNSTPSSFLLYVFLINWHRATYTGVYQL